MVGEHFLRASNADTSGKESALSPLLVLFGVVGLTKDSNLKILSWDIRAPPLSITNLTGALSSRALERFSVFTGGAGLVAGRGLGNNLSMRGHVGPMEEKPPAKDLTGAVLPGHGGGAA